MNHLLRQLICRFRRTIRWLWHQEGTPAHRARGLAIGVFSGCFPLFGLQTVLGITLAKLFRGNYLLAVIGTWISNPITYLPLYWLNYQVGCLLLGQGPGWNDLGKLSLGKVWSQGWTFSSRLLLGSALTGILLGLMVGIIYVLLVRFSHVLESKQRT